MKKHLLLFFLLLTNHICRTQTMSISDEINIGNAEAYGMVGKFSDRYLFYIIENNTVKLQAFDGKMRKTWDKELEPERKNYARIIEVAGSKQDFNVVYQFRKKGHNYLKAHKYDPQGKLLDSFTLKDLGRDIAAPPLQYMTSEDKKVMLIYYVEGNNTIKAVALGLDSIRLIWEKEFSIRNWDWDDDRLTKQIILNNRAEVFFIKENDNKGSNLEKHTVSIKHFNPYEGEKDFDIKMSEIYSLNMRFSYDNYNRQLVAAGLYASKISVKAQGTFYISLTPPQYETIKLMFNPFDDEFVTAFLGKKVNENKGLPDLRVQEIVHRRDGGILAIVEQVREVTRQMTNITGSLSMRSSGIRLLMDYFYDNFFAVSFSPDGATHWKSIFYKKQMSQDDDARHSSYFLMKSTSALRFLYNDDVDRATTVSEYVLDAKGANEHNTIYNTDGQGINFRFRDALQVSVNEVLVPSEDRRRVKLVKIQY